MSLEQAPRVRHSRPDAMARYLVAETRPDGGYPPYLPIPINDYHTFQAVQTLDEHPFICRENLVYASTADLNFNTEVLNTLIERNYIDTDEIISAPRNTGEVIVTNHKDRKLFGIIIKDHINDRVLKKDVTTCLENLRALTTNLEIRSLGII